MKQPSRCHSPVARSALAVILATAVAVVFTGCESKKASASQVAAKVNSDEISVHQINLVLQRQTGLRPEQADVAGKAVLERLIDQELAVQKAQELKIDRDPQVVMMMEAAKRDIIARAYLERISDSIAKPTSAEVKAYYDSKPALFSERRVYQLQELTIDAPGDEAAALRTKLEPAKSVAEIVDYLKAHNLHFASNQAVRASEQLPMSALDSFAKMNDGQVTIAGRPGGLQVIAMLGSRAQPASLEQATPAIEQFLINDRKRDVVEKDVKALRTAAKIEYVGKFAQAAGDAAENVASNAITNAQAGAAAAAPASVAASGSGLDATTISKGMGLK